MHTQVMDVTPELAQAWLKQNTFNRPISAPTVRRYASDMSNGRWKLNHQGLAFSEEGVLVDGQHRLMAIVKADSTVKMMVTWGANRTGIDELRPRSAIHVIQFGEMSDWVQRRHLECAKQMAMLCSGRSANGVLSTSELVDVAENNKDAIIFAENLFPTHVRGISTAAVRAVIATSYYHFDQNDLREFVSSLYSGIVSSPDRAAVIRARELLLSGGFSGGAVARKSTTWKIMRAVVAFCDRQPISRLMEQTKMPFAVPEDNL